MSETARVEWIERVLGFAFKGRNAHADGKNTSLGCLFAGTADSLRAVGKDARSPQAQSLISAARGGAAFCEECSEGAP